MGIIALPNLSGNHRCFLSVRGHNVQRASPDEPIRKNVEFEVGLVSVGAHLWSHFVLATIFGDLIFGGFFFLVVMPLGSARRKA